MLPDQDPGASRRWAHIAHGPPAAPGALWHDGGDGELESLLSHVHILDPDHASRMALHARVAVRADAVVRAFRSVDQLLATDEEREGGCILLSGVSGAARDAIVGTLAADPRFVVVVLGGADTIAGVIATMKAGAHDFLPPPVDDAALHGAIDAALAVVRHRAMTSRAAMIARTRIARLSAREREVLCGLIEGKSNKMIALSLRISPRTIEIYRAHLMDKLGVHTLSEVLKIALSAGIDITSPGFDLNLPQRS